MCTPWIINKLARCPGKVMCKGGSYINQEQPNNRRSSNNTSSSTSPREISTSFFSSPTSSPPSTLEPRSTVLIASDHEVLSGGSNTPRRILFLPQIKRGNNKLKRRVTVTIGSNQSTSSGSGDLDEADWPPSADEDYIVFCFKEDGAFHVVEESPKNLSPKLGCEDHGNVACACSDENKDVNHLRPITRRDCLLPNKEAEEEEMRRSQFSPRRRHQDVAEASNAPEKHKVMLSNESISIKPPSVDQISQNESIISLELSRLGREEQFHDKNNPQVGCSSWAHNSSRKDDNHYNDSPTFTNHCLLPNEMVDEEEEIYSSPKFQLGPMTRIDDLLKARDSSGSNTSMINDQRLEEDEEQGLESAKSSMSDQSDSKSSSFEFPVLEWEWIGSPIRWATSGSLHNFRKHKTRRPCLRFCRF